jgi:hypothetical protein
VVLEKLTPNTQAGKQTPVFQYHAAGQATDRPSTAPNDDDDNNEHSEVLM